MHKLIEEGRIAVRNVRRDALHQVNDYGNQENISEDEIKGSEMKVLYVKFCYLNGLRERKLDE